MKKKKKLSTELNLGPLTLGICTSKEFVKEKDPLNTFFPPVLTKTLTIIAAKITSFTVYGPLYEGYFA